MDALNAAAREVGDDVHDMAVRGDRHIAGQGTPETAWGAAGRLEALPRVMLDDLLPPGSRAVVVAPHPDDEVIACGGLLAALCGRRQPAFAALVVGVTDGEAAYGDAPPWPADRLAPVRRRERERGLTALGVPSSCLRTLGFPDGGVAGGEAALERTLERLLAPGDVLVTTWRLDGHPDHEACGRVAARLGARHRLRLLEAPVWTWHWAAPCDARVPWSRLSRLDLPADLQRRKAAALGEHVSQCAPGEPANPVLPDWARARMARRFETFFVLPEAA